MYGSTSAHACASLKLLNSAIINEPVNPAAPGSLLSMAGHGPATTQRP